MPPAPPLSFRRSALAPFFRPYNFEKNPPAKKEKNGGAENGARSGFTWKGEAWRHSLVVPQVYSTCFTFMAKGMAPSASASGYFR